MRRPSSIRIYLIFACFMNTVLQFVPLKPLARTEAYQLTVTPHLRDDLTSESYRGEPLETWFTVADIEWGTLLDIQPHHHV